MLSFDPKKIKKYVELRRTKMNLFFFLLVQKAFSHVIKLFSFAEAIINRHVNLVAQVHMFNNEKSIQVEEEGKRNIIISLHEDTVRTYIDRLEGMFYFFAKM